VAERPHLGEHQRRALVVGQVIDVDDQVAEILAALDLDGETVGRLLLELERGTLATRAEDRRQRLRAMVNSQARRRIGLREETRSL
jgi:hypothetical protein